MGELQSSLAETMTENGALQASMAHTRQAGTLQMVQASEATAPMAGGEMAPSAAGGEMAPADRPAAGSGAAASQTEGAGAQGCAACRQNVRAAPLQGYLTCKKTHPQRTLP